MIYIINNKIKMFVIILIIFATSNLYSQDVVKKYDKYENKFYLSLEDELVLYINAQNETQYFNLNILKIYNSEDTTFYLRILAKKKNKYLCSEVDTRCIISYSKDKFILTKPLFIDYESKVNTDIYYFDFPIQKTDLLNLLFSNEITIYINCSNGELEGEFSEDNIEDFRNFIIKYVK